MAKFDVLDMSGKKVSEIELSDAIFGIQPNERVMHAAVVNFWPISVRAPRAPRPAARFRRRPQALASEGHRPAPVRVPSAHRSGPTAALHWAQAP